MNVLFLDDVADADLPRLLDAHPEPEARALVRDELNARSLSPQHFATVPPTENPETTPMNSRTRREYEAHGHELASLDATGKIEAVPAVETPPVPAAPPETLSEYLVRVRAKDFGKGHGPSSGWRTTREVSEFFESSLSVARRMLEDAVEAGTVEKSSDGSSGIWRSTTPAEGETPVAVDGPFAGIADPNVHLWGERLGPLVNEYEAWCTANNLPHVSAEEQDGAALTPEQYDWNIRFIHRWEEAQAADDAAPAGISTLVAEGEASEGDDYPPIPLGNLRISLVGAPIVDEARSFSVHDGWNGDVEIARIVENRLGETWEFRPCKTYDPEFNTFPTWGFRDFAGAQAFAEAWAWVVDGDVPDPAVVAQDAEFEAAAIAARADIRVEIPTRPEDEDLSECERMGFRNFAEGEGIDQNPHGPEEGGWVRGWWLAHARCYGQGVKAAVAHEATFHPAGPELVNPYPAFSPAGEAWASGADEAEAL